MKPEIPKLTKEKEEQYLTVGQLAARYSLTRDGIYKKLRRGQFPGGYLFGRAHRWALSEIVEWESKQVFNPSVPPVLNKIPKSGSLECSSSPSMDSPKLKKVTKREEEVVVETMGLEEMEVLREAIICLLNGKAPLPADYEQNDILSTAVSRQYVYRKLGELCLDSLLMLNECP